MGRANLRVGRLAVQVVVTSMTRARISDPILARFRAELDALYGDRLERVVLFGSRARGDPHPDSDYDVAVFLRDLTDRWHEARRLSAIETDILAETGAFIHAMPYRAGAYRERTPLMHEIRREGVDL
jgi:predicted nucleotidyltransferase